MIFGKEYFNRKMKWWFILGGHFIIGTMATIIGVFWLDVRSVENFLLVFGNAFFNIFPIGFILALPLIFIVFPIYIYYLVKILRSRTLKNYVIFEIVHVITLSLNLFFLKNIPA